MSKLFGAQEKKSFGQKFLDPVAMEFLLDEKNNCSQSEGTDCRDEKKSKAKNCTYHEYTVPNVIASEVCQSAALGPSWYKQKSLTLAGLSERKITYSKCPVCVHVQAY